MIAIIDYGMGNLRSVQKAFEKMGIQAVITAEQAVIESAQGLVIPGVGAFEDAMKNLRDKKLDQWIMEAVEKQTPLLGICLGMQVLFQWGEEGEGCQGLGLLKGDVVKLPEGEKIPHMGWNALEDLKKCQLLEGVGQGDYVYFVHSYYVRPEVDEVIKARAGYGINVPAIVQQDHILGVQFHPEKSGDVGLQILKKFGEMVYQ
ncbi:imidazole glycerol phosphate synthase, glutamine amidotransferase subunit [Alkaliphilus metalliredigens QYMF]|uniref:Imidazole glycerol phosphate synthase subunit HisH n=1 Tax=Alkaliphilus metalliredigens (strain QYMF) TaxID=293826 RepID=A6TKT4_ALKMQ|nr:imidazole glycerol phosphate synthase subunit HisH [Alkaliphilus metalliredigens]ABR46802.1 imidazole glycerol phosphate synthase, glutamine amidotransferase subunit [Alkaliphilus metalliredigens QYMF]